MAKKKISSTDLLWIFRERLAFVDERFKLVPLAIIPGKNDWEVVTSPHWRKNAPQFAQHLKRIQAELRAVYTLARD